MTEWIELTDLQSVAKAQADGWEIEFKSGKEWTLWTGKGWYADQRYRARPRQPVTRKVKMLCYFAGLQIMWRSEDCQVPKSWVRVPAEDKTIEVPEETE